MGIIIIRIIFCNEKREKFLQFQWDFNTFKEFFQDKGNLSAAASFRDYISEGVEAEDEQARSDAKQPAINETDSHGCGANQMVHPYQP